MSGKPSYPWFRFYDETLSEVAVRELSHLEFRVLISCFGFANRSPEEDRFLGALTVSPSGKPVPVRFIAEMSGADVGATEAALDKLKRNRIIEVRKPDGAMVIALNWAQFESDSSTRRVKQHRESKRIASERQTSVASPSLPEGEDSRRKQSRANQSRPEGNVPEDVPSTTDGFGPDVCWECNGSGQIEGQACPDCRGTGDQPHQVDAEGDLGRFSPGDGL